MTGHNSDTKNLPHGAAQSLRAPFSGNLSDLQVEASLATLPGSVKELRRVWETIVTCRNSGLMPIFEGGPLDNAERNGEWDFTLQQRMPTASGLPGSRGTVQKWPYDDIERFDFTPGENGGNFDERDLLDFRKPQNKPEAGSTLTGDGMLGRGFPGFFFRRPWSDVGDGES